MLFNSQVFLFLFLPIAYVVFWMLRTNTAYPEIVRIESNPRLALVGEGQTV